MQATDSPRARAARPPGGPAVLLALALAAAHGPVAAQAAVESGLIRSTTTNATAGARAPVPAPRVSAKRARGTRPVDGGDANGAPEKSGPICAGGLPDPVPIRVHAGKSTLVNLPENVVRRTLGDPEIVTGRMLSTQVLYLVSGKVGNTNAILEGESGKCVVLDIAVLVDTDAIQAKLAELLPGERSVRVASVGDSVVLSGTVSDAVAIERVVAIATAFIRSAYQPGGVKPGDGKDGQGRIVNLLSITAPQQVMLEVKVAEVSKNMLDKLGASLNASTTRGSWSYQLLSNFLSGTAGGVAGAVQSPINNLILEAEKGDGLVRILAEPNVMAISGQEGSFLAGGKILIPVSQTSANGGVTIGLEEKEFGVGLRFTPTVLSDGRINLQVAPEVSELSRDGVGVTATGIGASAVLPLITTRRAATTIQLYDGQSFAIGGLLRSSTAANIKAFPVLGELPVIGALFRSTDFQQDLTELVFVVTPRLVKPLPPDYRLPTDRVGEPNRRSVFIEGRLDSDGASPTGAATGAASQELPAGAPARGGMQLK